MRLSGTLFMSVLEKVQGGFFMQKIKQHPLMGQVLLLIGMSVVFLLPQIIGKGMILGSDVVFHFNRFYETSQQIKADRAVRITIIITAIRRIKTL